MSLAYAARPPEINREDLEGYALAVADVAAELVPDHLSILWKGSAQKPWDGPYDFLPGLSDIDIHIYRQGVLADPWAMRQAVMHRVGPPPWDTPLQLLALDTATLPDWWLVMSYEVLHGSAPPISTPSTDVLLQRDRVSLAEAHRHSTRVGTDVLGLSDGELWTYLRSVRWMFPPIVQRIATISGHPPEEVWSMNRTNALALVTANPATSHLATAAADYFEAALRACERRDGPSAERALRAGQSLLDAAGQWAASQPDAVIDRRTATPTI
ncbi:MAG: hypothetical protein OEM94_09430 [Acidimicrobiia bacterium]|nr:hypothetical protein [Acidimicrobiia bacterium]